MSYQGLTIKSKTMIMMNLVASHLITTQRVALDLTVIASQIVRVIQRTREKRERDPRGRGKEVVLPITKTKRRVGSRKRESG